MTKISSLLIYSLLLLPTSALAGLNISDSPLFVTQTLPPNVFLSPVYASGANEVSLMNMDWTLGAGTTNTAKSWNSYINDYYWGYPHRVFPWPEVYIGNPSAKSQILDSCATLYGDDYGISGSSYVKYPLNVSDLSKCSTIDSGARSRSNASFVDIPPYNNSADLGFYNGMAEYTRSNMNILYYNNKLTYTPWPYASSMSIDTNNPYYYPGKSYQYSGMNAGSSAYLFQLDSTFPTSGVTECNAAGSNGVCSLSYTPAMYWTYNANNNQSISDPANFAANAVADQSNFTTWFTYWRSADLATRSILGNFVHQLANKSQEISGVRLWLNYNGNFTLLYDPVVQNSVGNVFSSIYGAPALNGSLVNAVGHDYVADFLADGSSGASKAFLDNPNGTYDAATNPARSCRRNYQIIVTPDYTGLRWSFSNGTGSGLVGQLPLKRPSSGNADSATGMDSLYHDNYSSTWSDLGAAVWNTDLSSSLQNNLLATSTDPKTSQHLTLFLVGPAAPGLVFPADVANYDTALSILKTSPPSTWVNPMAQAYNSSKANYDASYSSNPGVLQARDQAASIDDLWHMVLNSRGFFYQSTDIAGMTSGLMNALHEILVPNASGSGVSTNTTSVQTGSQIYQATVDHNWQGHLRAYSLTANTTTINNVQSNVANIDYGTAVWDLATSISAQASRKIFTYNRDNGTGSEFALSSLDTSANNAFSSAFLLNGQANKAVEYLSGSGECEDGATTTCADSSDTTQTYVFRRRNIDRSNTLPYSATNPDGRNVLGDISNSSPWFVSPPLAGMSDLDFPGYNAFRISNQGRANAIYVGANDGMLHAVNAVDGSEFFSYIPSLVLGNLPALTSTSYSHQYYTDGSPFTADVNVNGWRTVLAGGLNKGGKGYYLLDVTDPAKFDTGKVLWEFSQPDMNYSYNIPVAFPAGNLRAGQSRQIVRMNDGKWALIVGNGYPADSGRQACIYIVYLSGPSGSNGSWVANTDYREFCVGENSYSTDGGLDTNGLSTPTPYDTNGDGSVDFIYAGDLNGNLWKFDVSSKDPNDSKAPWGPAFAGNPLFVAKNDGGTRQPIVAPPELMPLSMGSASGELVLFGTGKYIEDSDRTNTAVQSFYGVWDRNLAALSNLDRSSLTQQIMTTSGSIRTQSSSTPVPYCSDATLATCGSSANNKLGWYWDMPDSGERLTAHATLLSGIIFFNTFYPLLDNNNLPDPCQAGGGGWLMGLDAVNGTMINTFPVFDTNQDSVINANDTNASGQNVGAVMGGTSFVSMGPSSYVGVFSSATPAQPPLINVNRAHIGRVSWFELIN